MLKNPNIRTKSEFLAALTMAHISVKHSTPLLMISLAMLYHPIRQPAVVAVTLGQLGRDHPIIHPIDQLQLC